MSKPRRPPELFIPADTVHIWENGCQEGYWQGYWKGREDAGKAIERVVDDAHRPVDVWHKVMGFAARIARGGDDE